MKMEQVSANCFAVLNEKNLVCDANSGLINLGGGDHLSVKVKKLAVINHVLVDQVKNTSNATAN